MNREEFLRRVKTLREEGKTFRAIAAELEVHRSRVERALRTLYGEMPAPSPHSEPAPGSVFVGRQHEMVLLKAALEEVLAGHGRVEMLAGEPGIGKTRTAQELAHLAQRLRFQVLWGHCYEGLGAPAYWPWIQIVRSYIHNRSAAQVRSTMQAGAADISQIVRELRTILPDLETSPTLDSPEANRFRLFDSIVAFLKRASFSAKGLVLILDNLHTADASSLLLLQYLAQEMDQSRLMVLGTLK